MKALFNSLPPEDYKNGVLVLGGDGRYFNREAAQVSRILVDPIFSCPLLYSFSNFWVGELELQIIIKIAAGNDVGKILVGKWVSRISLHLQCTWLPFQLFSRLNLDLEFCWSFILKDHLQPNVCYCCLMSRLVYSLHFLAYCIQIVDFFIGRFKDHLNVCWCTWMNCVLMVV